MVEQLLILAILAGIFGLFLWGRWRYDVVAFGALLIAVVVGVVAPASAFSGFSHPATVTVATVLILSRALTNSGVTDLLAKAMAPATGHTVTHLGALSGIAAVMSSFMNNVGALALLMPVAIRSANQAERSASKILMPLSFASILGGLVTLIGTPPNIIIATYRGQVTGEPFKMFDFLPVGGTVALVGCIFVVSIGWRLIAGAGRAKAASAGSLPDRRLCHSGTGAPRREDRRHDIRRGGRTSGSERRAIRWSDAPWATLHEVAETGADRRQRPADYRSRTSRNRQSCDRPRPQDPLARKAPVRRFCPPRDRARPKQSYRRDPDLRGVLSNRCASQAGMACIFWRSRGKAGPIETTSAHCASVLATSCCCMATSITCRK